MERRVFRLIVGVMLRRKQESVPQWFVLAHERVLERATKAHVPANVEVAPYNAGSR